MKKHSVGTAFDDGVGADIIFGTVRSISPMKISVDSSLTVDASRLIIPRYLSGESFSMSFNGAIGTGTTENKLTVGAKVCMIRVSGGQRYVVIGIIG